MLCKKCVFLLFLQNGGKGVSNSGEILMYIEDITRLREDMDFMFEWQEQ